MGDIFNLIRLCVDFGLVILIWMTQLVVYPSFSFYEKKNLQKWHRIYMIRISIITLPLMLSQSIFGALSLIESQNFHSIAYAIGVIFLWAITFIKFVPLHFSIENQYNLDSVKKLTTINWYRTAVWSALFVHTIIYLYTK